VRKVWTEVDVKTHSDDVLAAIDELQSNFERPGFPLFRARWLKAPKCARVSEPVPLRVIHESQILPSGPDVERPCLSLALHAGSVKTETVNYKAAATR